jgi:hypothetical protein
VGVTQGQSARFGLAAIERSWHREASRITWLKEGDACTRFFHLKANGHSRRNYISCLKKGNGEYAWTHGEKEEVFYSYFQNIMGTTE